VPLPSIPSMRTKTVDGLPLTLPRLDEKKWFFEKNWII
jgi:hypothetical protein